MKDLNKVILITHARLSSVRIPNKMIKPFYNNQSLFEICCEKLADITLDVDVDIRVSVHEPELMYIARKVGVRTFQRSKESAKSESSIAKIYEWWQPFIDEGYEYVIMVNACFPFLSKKTIKDFIWSYITIDNEGMFGVIPRKDYFWNNDGMLNHWPEGQDLMNTRRVETTYQAAHALYASRLDSIGKGYWMAKMPLETPKLYPLPEKECLDIDEPWQFDMCRILYSGGYGCASL